MSRVEQRVSVLPGVRIASRVALTLLVLAGAVWGTLFLWYRVPGAPAGASVAAGAFAVLATVTLAAVLRGRGLWLLPFAAVLAALVLAFSLQTAQDGLDWAPDVARPLRAEITADRVTIEDLREMDWHSDTEGTPHWSRQSYVLADIRTIDLINSYWAGPVIAHTLLSFGFADGRYVTFSVEIRRRRDQEYSNIAGFFREYELVYVAADERDIVRVRTGYRHEDVQLYRVKAEPAQVRAMFLQLLQQANRIADRPGWYNTLTANCTTEMFHAARIVAPGLPFDWRVIVSGYLPEYAYDEGLLDRRIPFPALREASRVSKRANEAGNAADFSQRIRIGIPDPNR